MDVYNSSAGSSNQDDSDITIINRSVIHEHNNEDMNNTYVPIITRLKQANNSSENRQITNPQINDTCQSVDNKYGYIFVDHDPENAKQLEQVLKFYILDLKQETNTQLVCDKQLVTRLMDLIRPAYLNHEQKTKELDNIIQEIGLLHDKRHMDQLEKIEQLRTEVRLLNKRLCDASNDNSLCIENNNRNYSMFSTIHGGNSIHDYDQWTEIEDDAKKLHEIVQSQKNQINEIVNLISQTATASTSLDTPIVPFKQSEETETSKPTTTTPPTNNNLIGNLLEKIRNITGTSQQPATTAPQSHTELINPSPGASPSDSFSTLVSDILKPPTDDTIKNIDNQPPIPDPPKPIDNQRPIPNPPKPIDNQPPIPNPPKPIDNQPATPDRPHVPINIPITPPLPAEPRRCPVCNHEFSATSEDVEMYDHIENCLFPTGINTQPKDYTCPNCERTFPGSEEMAYQQHLADCYNI